MPTVSIKHIFSIIALDGILAHGKYNWIGSGFFFDQLDPQTATSSSQILSKYPITNTHLLRGPDPGTGAWPNMSQLRVRTNQHLHGPSSVLALFLLRDHGLPSGSGVLVGTSMPQQSRYGAPSWKNSPRCTFLKAEERPNTSTRWRL